MKSYTYWLYSERSGFQSRSAYTLTDLMPWYFSGFQRKTSSHHRWKMHGIGDAASRIIIMITGKVFGINNEYLILPGAPKYCWSMFEAFHPKQENRLHFNYISFRGGILAVPWFGDASFSRRRRGRIKQSTDTLCCEDWWILIHCCGEKKQCCTRLHSSVTAGKESIFNDSLIKNSWHFGL